MIVPVAEEITRRRAALLSLVESLEPGERALLLDELDRAYPAPSPRPGAEVAQRVHLEDRARRLAERIQARRRDLAQAFFLARHRWPRGGEWSRLEERAGLEVLVDALRAEELEADGRAGARSGALLDEEASRTSNVLAARLLRDVAARLRKGR